MLPAFKYDIRDRAIAIGIAAVLFSVTTLMLPYIQASMRNNRVYILGLVCLAVMSCLMLRYTLTGFLLLGYLTVSLFLSVSESMGSAMYQILCFSGLFLIGMATHRKWSYYKAYVYNAVCIIAILNVCAQVIQAFGVSFPRGLDPYGQYGFVGLMANCNETSALLAICLPFFFRKGWVWLIPYVVGGMFMARTTNGLAAAMIISSIWMVMKYRRYVLYVLPALAVLGLLYVVSYDPLNLHEQARGRGLIYKATAMAATVKPFGWGFGQFDYVMPLLTYAGHIKESKQGDAFGMWLIQSVADKKALDAAARRVSGESSDDKVRAYIHDIRNDASAMFIQAHNDYLEAWFATGYAGLIFLLAFLWRSIVRGFRRTDKIPVLALVASASTAMFFFVWQIVPIAILTVLCLVLVNVKEEPYHA